MLWVVRPIWQFHRTGGALCLDFANTMSWRRSASPIERLASYADLASWARQVGLISESEEASLCADATSDPRRSRRIMGRARSLRGAIFDTFAALSEGRIPMEEIGSLEPSIQQAVVHSELARDVSSYRWEPLAVGDRMQRVLYAIACSAGDLLTSTDISRIGQCSGPDCRWLWVDRTRNKSRRWCDMKVCGNRVKAQRHYQRARQAAGAPT
jgi:predicted RNA-binding Zn ribbon-like protein